MKKKLISILFCIGVLAVIFSGCQKENQLATPSAISTNASISTNESTSSANESIGHTFNATFTKWVTNFPIMEGVVGGDVGTGTFEGDVLSISSAGDITTIDVLYHFNGRIHSFTAHNLVTWNTALGTAVITGLVTEGWLKGATVTGEFDVKGICPIPTPGNAEGTTCYQGVLHIAVPKVDIH
ncbi:MAG: hypothetical protein ABJA71_14540 [Ginsengibacter sp.]